MPVSPIFQAYLNTLQSKRELEQRSAREDDPNSLPNKHWDMLWDEYTKRYGEEQAVKKADESINRIKVGVTPTDAQGNPINVVKPGVSGPQPVSTPDQGNVGVPGVGPLGRIQPEPQLQQRATTGVDVGQTTLPGPSGPPQQADSINPLANYFRQFGAMQGATGPTQPADTLGQPTPGQPTPLNRAMQAQADAGNMMAGQGQPSVAAPMAGLFTPPPQGQTFIQPDGHGGFMKVQAPSMGEGQAWLRGTAETERMGGAKAGQLYPTPMSAYDKTAATREAGINALTVQNEAGAKEGYITVPDELADALQIDRGSRIKFSDYAKFISEKGAAGSPTLAKMIEERYAPGTTSARQKVLDKEIERMKERPPVIQVQYGNVNDPNSLINKYSRTTFSGQKYIDASNLRGSELANIDRQGRSQNLPVLSSQEVDSVRNIDTARQNQQDMFDALKSVMPPDALSRPGYAASNTVAKYLQTKPVIAAFGAYRSAAIQALRAAAGAKGLRINQAEIYQAVEMDIPKPTDTIATAFQRGANMNKMFDSQENALMRKDVSALNRGTFDKANKVSVKIPDDPRWGKWAGKTKLFDTKENADSFKKEAGIP